MLASLTMEIIEDTATDFNPKIKLVRDKTLMQDHDCCNHKYIWTR